MQVSFGGLLNLLYDLKLLEWMVDFWIQALVIYYCTYHT